MMAGYPDDALADHSRGMAAVQTLERLRYTWEGGEEWRPPIGDPPKFDGDDGFEWAVVEIFGHRRHVGRCREEEKFGAKKIRVDELQLGDDGSERWQTILYDGSAVFSYRPCTEEVARSCATRFYAPARITELPRRYVVDDEDFQEVDEEQTGANEPEHQQEQDGYDEPNKG